MFVRDEDVARAGTEANHAASQGHSGTQRRHEPRMQRNPLWERAKALAEANDGTAIVVAESKGPTATGAAETKVEME